MKKRTKNQSASEQETLEQKERLNNEKRRTAKQFTADDGGMGICGTEGSWRSSGAWLKLILYSVTFDACNATFWGLCLWVFYQTLDNYEPRLQVPNFEYSLFRRIDHSILFLADLFFLHRGQPWVGIPTYEARHRSLLLAHLVPARWLG